MTYSYLYLIFQETIENNYLTKSSAEDEYAKTSEMNSIYYGKTTMDTKLDDYAKTSSLADYSKAEDMDSLKAYINKIIFGSGCDVDTLKESGCAGIKECYLYNGVHTGLCCTPSNKCGINEGDCDNDSDCMEGLVCKDNNCPPPFSKDHDCCQKGNSRAEIFLMI